MNVAIYKGYRLLLGFILLSSLCACAQQIASLDPDYQQSIKLHAQPPREIISKAYAAHYPNGIAINNPNNTPQQKRAPKLSPPFPHPAYARRRHQSGRYAREHDSRPRDDIDISQIHNAIPKLELPSRYGNRPYYVVNGHVYHVLSSAKGYNKTGFASWYGMKFQGYLTSTRERYDLYGMTAASPELPLPTYVRVTNLDNGRSVVVKVNDRGPFKSHRLLDLSYAAARKLGYAKKGTAHVRVTAINLKRFAKNQAEGQKTG